MRMSRTVLGGALGETPEVYSLCEGQAPLIANLHATLRQVMQSANGSFLASKHRLDSLSKTLARPRYLSVGRFVRSYANVRPRGAIFRKQRRAHFG